RPRTRKLLAGRAGHDRRRRRPAASARLPADSDHSPAAASGAGSPPVRGSAAAPCGVEPGRVTFSPSTDACGPVAGVPVAAVPSAARAADSLAVMAPGNTLVNVT